MRLSGMPTCAEERVKVLIIPRVTVLFNPTGLPTAIAQSPTCTSAELPKVATARARARA